MALPINVSPHFKRMSTLSTFIPSFILPSVHTIWFPVLLFWKNSLQNQEWKIAKPDPWACVSSLQCWEWFLTPSFWKSCLLHSPFFLSSFLIIKNKHQGAEDFLFTPALGNEISHVSQLPKGLVSLRCTPGVLTHYWLELFSRRNK